MRVSAILLLLGAASCAVLADSGGGDRALPNAKAGPFRPIAQSELGLSRTAPYALRDDDDFPRDITVVDTDGDPTSFEVFGYVAQTQFEEGEMSDPAAAPNQIVRYVAADARSFERSPLLVLEPTLAWEQETVGAPSVLRNGSEFWLYYEAAGKIGLATSVDGANFERREQPVLTADASSWENGEELHSPSVLKLPDGTFRMFYGVGSGAQSLGIAEARSEDGIGWARGGEGPVLAPASSDALYDQVWLGAPCAVVATSPAGRDILWLYYAATDKEGRQTIAVAARDGYDGPFVRGAAPVFGTDTELAPHEPAVIRYPDFTLLFATQRAGSGSGQAYPAVAIGLAPAVATLPPPP